MQQNTNLPVFRPPNFIVRKITTMFGIIRRAKNYIRNAEAAAALENLLALQGEMGNLQGNPHNIANDMISETWQRSMNNASWITEKPPHRVSLVAFSLAERLQKTRYGDPSFFGYSLALAAVFATVTRKHSQLGFSQLDEHLMMSAWEVQQKAIVAMDTLPITAEIKA